MRTKRDLFRIVVVPALACMALTAFSACSILSNTTKKIARTLRIIEHVDDTALPEAPPAYREAMLLLQTDRPAEALTFLQSFVRQESASAYTQSAQLNIGRALEALSRWFEASEVYRSVVVSTEGVAPTLQAMALYRLSFCHEALGHEILTVATLTDLYGSNRYKHLPNAVGRAELPARLASAYARTGNFSRAVENYDKAEVGIVQLRREAIGSKIVPEWLPRTLYFMGTLSFRSANWQEFESSLRPLVRGQTYLLESAEFGQPPWSDRAAKDLMSAYRDLWKIIVSPPIDASENSLILRRQNQNLQWERAALVLQALAELRARGEPQTAEVKNEARQPSVQAKSIFAFVNDLEKQIYVLLAARPVGEGATAESMVRRSGPRGRVSDRNIDTSLERKFLEQERKTKDPNL